MIAQLKTTNILTQWFLTRGVNKFIKGC